MKVLPNISLRKLANISECVWHNLFFFFILEITVRALTTTDWQSSKEGKLCNLLNHLSLSLIHTRTIIIIIEPLSSHYLLLYLNINNPSCSHLGKNATRWKWKFVPSGECNSYMSLYRVECYLVVSCMALARGFGKKSIILNQLVLEPKTFLQWLLLFFKLTTSRHDETNKD